MRINTAPPVVVYASNDVNHAVGENTIILMNRASHNGKPNIRQNNDEILSGQIVRLSTACAARNTAASLTGLRCATRCESKW